MVTQSRTDDSQVFTVGQIATHKGRTDGSQVPAVGQMATQTRTDDSHSYSRTDGNDK
jgi:hypothetical protein